MVVGVGCAPDLITMRAARIIFNAKRVAGSAQALGLAEEYIQEGCKVYVLQDYFKLDEFPEDTVVLSTGDPMLVGLLPKSAEVEPGISSLQVAFARLRIPLETASVVPAMGKYHHTKAVSDCVKEAKRKRNVFVLVDSKFDLPGLAKALVESRVDCRIAVCENLGYEDERIEVGTPSEPPSPRSDLFSIVLGIW